MLVKATLQEIYEKILSNNVQIVDNTICGECSKCGECCTNFLPVSQKEVFSISNYVIKNGIKPQKHILVMQNRLSCPYYDGKKCLIYKARPLICREYFCNKEPNIETAKKFSKEEYITVNMWNFAEEIEKIRRNTNRKVKDNNECLYKTEEEK